MELPACFPACFYRSITGGALKARTRSPLVRDRNCIALAKAGRGDPGTHESPESWELAPTLVKESLGSTAGNHRRLAQGDRRTIRLAEGRPLAGQLGIDPDRHI